MLNIGILLDLFNIYAKHRYFLFNNLLMQIEVNVQRRKNWVKKLEKQPRKRVEVSLGNIIFSIFYYFLLYSHFLLSFKKMNSTYVKISLLYSW